MKKINKKAFTENWFSYDRFREELLEDTVGIDKLETPSYKTIDGVLCQRHQYLGVSPAIVYDDYYIITKTSIEYGENPIYYKSSIDKAVVEELKNLINQTESESNESPLGILPIQVNLNNGHACTVHSEGNLIKKIVESLNYDGEIWYVE